MSLISEAKSFFRDVVGSLEVTLERIERGNAQQRLLLSAQLVGSCDSTIVVLMFIGENVRTLGPFSTRGIEKVTALRKEAKRIRREAFAESFTVTEASESGDENDDYIPEHSAESVETEHPTEEHAP